jgi:phosphoadenosine phosphosulfate reductase
LTLDRQVFVDRGDVISAADAPAKAVRRLRARVFWLDGQPLAIGAAVNLRAGTSECRGTIALIDHAVDPGELSASDARVIEQNHVGEIEIALSAPLAADLYAMNPRTGRIVLDLAGRIAGGGLVLATDSEGGQRERAAGVEQGAAARPNGERARERPSLHDLAVHAAQLNARLTDLSPAERLADFCGAVDGKVVFSTSFGLEDQVIFHLLCERAIDIDIATLDTGRLFPETYELWAETERRYGRRIRALYPQHPNLEALVAKQGINGFYDSREARSACCCVRKVEPLDRALAGARAWIVGLRADQSDHRHGLDLVTVDTERSLLKLSPLFDWTREAVHAFAADNGIPINPLHARGFASIGCAPCTRAVAPGEPERAGRWWWEQDDKKECGLHLTAPSRGPVISRGGSRPAGT